ncbi:MAG: MFS transporter [Pseudomonadota bacterium]
MPGFYRENMRWLAGGFLLALFSSFGQTFFISIWGAEIRAAFSLTHGGFGFIYMVATLASAATLPFIGRMVDVLSVARTSLVVILLLAAAALVMGSAHSVAMLAVALYMLRLFGQGMMTHTSITAMGKWYSANRGKAVSFATIGHQFGEGLAPATFIAIAAYVGWRGSWFVAAALLLFGALPLIYTLMRVERVPRSQAVQDSKALETGRQWTRAEMLRDPLFWLTGLGVFTPAFIGTSMFFHQDYLIALNGWPRWLYDTSFAGMAVTTVVVSLATGFAIDRVGAVRILPFFMLPLGISCLSLGLLDEAKTIIIFMLFLGLSYGMSSTLFGAFWPEVYGTRHLGSIRAITVSLMVFMSAVGPGVTGLLIDWGVPFQEQLLYMAAYCFVCIALMAVAARGYGARTAQAAKLPRR